MYPRPGHYPTYPGNGGGYPGHGGGYPGNGGGYPGHGGGYPGNGGGYPGHGGGNYNPQELRRIVENLSFDSLPSFTARQKAEANFGRELFEDTRFSANENISCKTCHIASKSFTDGRRVAIGMGVGKLNTPMNVNRFWSRWQFWDGRATHLASQALGPIESPVEHGSSRFKVAKVMFEDPSYRAKYRALFGEFPQGIEEITRFNGDAAPKKNRNLPTYLNDWCADTMDQQNNNIYPGGRYDIGRDSYFRPNTSDSLSANWERLPTDLRAAINTVFYNFGTAIGSYEKGIVAVNSPFDAFAEKFLETNDVNSSLVQGFGHNELQGLQYFYKQGGCISCHYGPNFSDEKFHNISLGPNNKYVFLGRAKGVIDAINDPFSCKGEGRQSCDELRNHRNSIYDLGAAKTPSLRNVSVTGPYMHDGRFRYFTTSTSPL